MNQKTITQLEYPLVLKRLSEFCITDIGKELCYTLTPKNTSSIVTKLLQETSEAFTLYSKKQAPPITSLPSIDYSIKLLESNGILSIKALLELATILKMAYSLKDYFFNDEAINCEYFFLLSNYFSSLYTNAKIYETVFLALIDENTVSDNASRKLFSIRK